METLPIIFQDFETEAGRSLLRVKDTVDDAAAQAYLVLVQAASDASVTAARKQKTILPTAPYEPHTGPYQNANDKLRLRCLATDASFFWLETPAPRDGLFNATTEVVDMTDAAIVAYSAFLSTFAVSPRGSVMVRVVGGKRWRRK